MSLLSPLTTFKTGDYTVTRTAAGSRVDGLWTDGSATTYANTPMQITPITAALMKTLPEGKSVEDTHVARCAFDLKINDVVTYNSEPHRVWTARRWTVRGVSYTWAMMTRERLGV